jgi:ligand-binding sensor domain-containing protein/signal transduction histidine kinase
MLPIQRCFRNGGWFLAFLLSVFAHGSAQGEVKLERKAALISASIPAVVVTGQVFEVSLTFSNVGPATWRGARAYLLPTWDLCFLFDQGNQGWIASHGLSPAQWTDDFWDGVIFADPTGDDPYLTKEVRSARFRGAPTDFVYVRLYPQPDYPRVHDLKLYWSTTEEDFYSEGKSVATQHFRDEGWMEVWFDVGSHPAWRGATLTALRLDFDSTNHPTRWVVDKVLVQRDGAMKEPPPGSDLNESSIPPGEAATFTVSCRAPDQAGLRRFDWSMGEKGAGWFGASYGKAIQIVASSNELAAAQSVFSYGSTSWHTDNGLPHNQVQALAQTTDGYLWIGTQKGLARFDGVRFTVFGPQQWPAFKSANITALCAASEGGLWIGTDGGGVTRWKDGTFTHCEGPMGNNIRCLCETSDGALWFGTTTGLSRWHEGKWTRWTKEDGLSDDTVRSLCEGESGDLWVGTGKRLNRWSEGKIAGTYDAGHGLDIVSIRGLWRDTHGEIWIASNGGLFCKTGDEFISFSNADGLEDQTCIAVRRDRRGTLWVGSSGGLNRRSNGRFVSELTANGEGYDLINAMLEDREGNVWIGGKDGLHRLRPTPFTTYTRRNGLSHNNVMSVCEDASGVLSAGTWGGGVSRLKDGKFATLTTKQGLIIDQVMGLCPLPDRSTWIGFDYERGLIRWHPDTGFVESHQRPGERQFATMRVIFRDHQDVLWLGTRDGLYQVQNKAFHRYGTTEGLPHDSIRAIFEDHAGVLWIGTQQGVIRRRADRFEKIHERTVLARSPVVSFYEDVQHALWMGTTGAGLFRISKTGAGEDHVAQITTRNGLFSDDVHGILTDDFGNFWMGCRQGIFRVSQRELNEVADGRGVGIANVAYGLQEGLVSTECNIIAQPSAWRGRDGRLWFATAKGLSVIDPKFNLKINETPPPVVIEEVLVDKQVQGPTARVQRDRAASAPSTLNIPPGRGELEIHYTALSFTAPEKNRFKYKLEGLETDWVDAETRHAAFYNNVPPGDYTFRVIACNNDGVWNSAGSSLKLLLRPHYWQTWWFKTLIIVASLTFVGSSVRYATRKRMQFKLERLEQQHGIEKERTRIAQDMHDDLGARLSEILLLSNLSQKPAAKPDEIKAQLTRIAHATHDLVDNLDAIVWAVNPRNDSFNRFVFYLYEYVPRYLETTSIRCLFDVPQPLMTTPLSSTIRHDLFLVLKEALNNVVKHALATEVRLSLRIEDDALIMILADNGHGFSAANRSLFGNGLNNMRDRIEKMGGSFELESETGKGTRLTTRIPIRPHV